MMFPSPLGAYSLATHACVSIAESEPSVSIPVRGLLFGDLKESLLSSLPLEFPSPLGAYSLATAWKARRRPVREALLFLPLQ